MIRIVHNAVVFVGDGRKALFLRNAGDDRVPQLKMERVFEDLNPPTHALGSDRPGRLSKGLHSGQRTAVESTDWHDLEEHRFVRQVAAAADRLVRDGGTEAMIVVAPPRTLAELRLAFHADVKRYIVAEIPKDLTMLPISAIEKHLRYTPASAMR